MIKFNEVNINDRITQYNSVATVRAKGICTSNIPYKWIFAEFRDGSATKITESSFGSWNKLEPRKPDEDLLYEFVDRLGSKTEFKRLGMLWGCLSSPFTALRAIKPMGDCFKLVDFDPFIVYSDGSIKFIDELENSEAE
jgi:hypothetical protein